MSPSPLPFACEGVELRGHGATERSWALEWEMGVPGESRGPELGRSGWLLGGGATRRTQPWAAAWEEPGTLAASDLAMQPSGAAEDRSLGHVGGSEAGAGRDRRSGGAQAARTGAVRPAKKRDSGGECARGPSGGGSGRGSPRNEPHHHPPRAVVITSALVSISSFLAPEFPKNLMWGR